MSEKPARSPGEQVTGAAGPPPPERRLARSNDYRREALADPDALAANLGAINGDLMTIAYRLLQATDAAFARSDSPLEDFASLLPAIGVGSQLARQIQRFAEFARRLRPPQAPKPALPLAPGPDGSTGPRGEENGS